MDTAHLIHTCYTKAVELLNGNTTSHGLLAAASHTGEGNVKNYAALYTRDIGISAFAILYSNTSSLYPMIKTSLITLTKAQSSHGQFPFYYKPEEEKIQWRDAGSIDSTLWWIIAFLRYYQVTKDTEFYKAYSSHLEKAFTWLHYQDVNEDLLLEQGEASDWADEMPRHGMVLYTNVLWYKAMQLRGEVEGSDEYLTHASKIKEAINTIFWVHKTKDMNTNYIPDNDYTKKNVFAKGLIEYINAQTVYLPYYLGFVAHKSFELRLESFGNVLSCLMGVADQEKSQLITDAILNSGMNRPYPLRSLYPVIYPGEPDWKPYMAKGRQNFPHQYHNGGIWPVIGGFWVMWLATYNKHLAHEELGKLARANSLNHFEFNEYLQGEHGTPMGVAHQSWSMSMYLAAYAAVYPHEQKTDILYPPFLHQKTTDSS